MTQRLGPDGRRRWNSRRERAGVDSAAAQRAPSMMRKAERHTMGNVSIRFTQRRSLTIVATLCGSAGEATQAREHAGGQAGGWVGGRCGGL